MKLKTLSEYKEIVEKYNGKYYTEDRWIYYKACLDIVREVNPNTVLELGPHQFPLIGNADIMDISTTVENITYYHDATVTPWPVSNKQYDLFIALQVWEHLGDKQQEAFREVIRIAKKAVLSFPYKWKVDVKNDHYGIDENVIKGWTCGVDPERIIKLSTRHMYYFIF